MSFAIKNYFFDERRSIYCDYTIEFVHNKLIKNSLMTRMVEALAFFLRIENSILKRLDTLKPAASQFVKKHCKKSKKNIEKKIVFVQIGNLRENMLHFAILLFVRISVGSTAHFSGVDGPLSWYKEFTGSDAFQREIVKVVVILYLRNLLR